MRIEKIVAGIDFGAPATEAARWAVGHLAPEAELTLAHVVDVPHPPAFRPNAARHAEVVAEAECLSARPRLEALAHTLTTRPARAVVRIGRAHEALAAIAYEVGADLVVIGPHGDVPREWKMLGTTAERLVRAAAPAVLVVGHAAPRPPRRLLVAVDEGPAASAVLAWARDLAERHDALVTLLHVVPHLLRRAAPAMAAVDAGAQPADDDADDAEAVSESERWLAERVVETGVNRTETLVARGHPGDAIVGAARALHAELVVMGRRGTSAVVPAVLGSTVSTVLHGAPCPVLVVTEEESDWIVGDEEG